MKIGYMRPHKDDLNCLNQKVLLEKNNCEKIVKEEHFFNKKRIELEELIDNLEKGDCIIISRLFVLGDSINNLIYILKIFSEKGVVLYSVEDRIDTSKDKKFLNILISIFEFERDIKSEKAKKGILEAKEKGIQNGRPRKSMENVKKAIEMYKSKEYTLFEIREKTGISKATLYRYLEKDIMEI